jgi:hypothetical protein
VAVFETEAEAFEKELAGVAGAARERQHLLVQRNAGRAEVERATGEVTRAREALSDEHDGAEQLASLSVASVAAMLRGTRDDQLRHQLAAREAARLTFLAAEERLAQALTDLARIEDRLVALGDVDAERRRLEDARARWLAVAAPPSPPDAPAPPSAPTPAPAERLGVLGEELREVDEALVAGHLAAARLAHAATVVGHASTGPAASAGGDVDQAVDQAVDELVAILRHCDLALGTFQRELADLVQGGVGPRVSDRWDDTVATFADGLYDDLDLATHRRAAAARVDDLRAEVDATLHAVRVHGRALADEAATLDLAPRRSA